MAANGLWGGRYKQTYLDIRVFNPLAPSNRHCNPSSCYHKHKNQKKREYEQRILETEHASFSPIVLACTGGLGAYCYIYLQTHSLLLADKWDQAYSSTMCWLRCILSFSLLRSSIQAIRGSRSSAGRALISSYPLIDRAISESRVSPRCGA